MKRATLSLIYLLLSLLSYSQINLNNGLIAYYPFNGNANDASGNNINGTVTNATLTTDRYGNPNAAYQFNGSSSYIQLPYSNLYNFAPQDSLSISVWILPELNPAWIAEAIVVKSPFNALYTQSNWNYGIYDLSNKAMTGFANTNFLQGTTTLSTNQCWYNITFTYKNGIWKLYVNGLLENQDLSQTKFILQDGSSKIVFGKKGEAFGDWYKGKIDEVRIYNRVLNQQEVSFLSQQNAPCLTNCSNWLKTPSYPSNVSVGDLDVTGNQLTVEASFSSSTALNPSFQLGKIVSKHTGPADVNYSLMASTCEITTTNGYVNTPPSCMPVNDKLYHLAMVYNGSVLKFYRNGYLVSSIPWTGNLINNDFLTTIGCGPNSPGPAYQQIGYINEVRIWNVARTQAQIRANMNTSLPNPSTQTGLLGYYTFDNLINKQGNTLYNGTINGAATINETNPNCNFITDSCEASVIPSCKFWPQFNPNSYTTTIPDNNTMTFGFSNSAHLIAPTAYSTLIPGNWFTPNPTIATTSPPNTTAHNTNDLGAIGIYPVISNETGSISFSSPPSQGFFLHVYQTVSRIDFDKSFTLTSSDGDLHVGNSNSLTNNVLIPDVNPLQSPDDANATIYFGPGISQVNFTLTAHPLSPAGDGIKFAFTFPENCTTANLGISGIVNQYTPALAFDPCKNLLTVGDATAFNQGDTVLLIQMKGAVIDSTNTAAFGTITDYKNSGNYEFNYVKSKTGNTIELKNVVTRNYDLPNGKVQLIRVPYYQNATITSTLTCPPWNGSTGGVLVLNAADSVTLNADIDVKGKGFRGGAGFNNNLGSTSNCFQNEYVYPLGSIYSGNKGESITSISNNITGGKGALASAGGAGLDHNGGGGGGANGGAGGFGGYQLKECGNDPFDNRGIGGRALIYNNAVNKIFMGGGGGSGHANNSGTVPAGGNGGGIIMINAQKIKNNGFKIIASGDSANICTQGAGITCHDGMGGGGAGGTVLLNVTQVLTSTTVEEKGGKGADMTGAIAGGTIGPGGGAGGGVLWMPGAAILTNVNPVNTGGIGGVLTNGGNINWGTTAGAAGINVFNLQVPVDAVPFKVNIDSVRFTTSNNSCNSFNFFGFGYVNSSPVVSWLWNFGDGNTAVTQNTSHTYSAAGTYTVRLTITDNNGCKDSILKSVVVAGTSAFDFSYKQDVCNPLSVQFTGAGAALVNPYWSFGDLGTSTGTLTPTHTYAVAGNYLVRFSVNNACNDTISKIISINVAQADIVITPDTTICFGSTKLLRAQYANNFCWSPATYLNNPSLTNPTTSTPTNITYYYTAEILGNNLIPNGDFSSGNTGFTSDYSYQTSNTVANAVYGVTTNAQTWNAGASPCLDHTTGTGNMLVANGATVPGVKLWKSSFSVTPNTSYQFSAWIQSVSLANFAVFKFYINGVQFGPTLNAPSVACQWVQQKLNWNSGNNTTVDLSLEDFTYNANGNDFALDDISFNSVSIKRDSVKITVDTPKIAAFGTATVCAGVTTQLNATGGATYIWTPATGLSNATIANPLATPAANTTYTVTGTTVNGCSAQATVAITVQPKPVITKSNDTSICKNTSVQLLATGGTSYTWTPAATLNNPNIANPIATPTAAVTKYYVTVINNNVNTCSNRDSVKVTIKPDPVFTVSPAQSTCNGTPVQLNASGGNIYLWSPAALVSNAAIANPTAIAGATTNYSVTITESICNISQTLSTLVTVNPVPLVTASKSNDIDCSIEFSNLSATGAVQYTWTPTTGLNNSSIANPVARPVTTTQYVVKGSNAFGCYDSDTLTVAVTKIGQSLYLMPNTFTPNGDGKNDCFGIKYWGIIEQLEFAIYNRYGERVFYTTDPYQCWNGLYKSDKPLPGNYVYYIKAKTACGMVERKGNVLLIR
ncbi:LamG-like jellyroll fold domain-containing protein [Ferruginibacter sp. SUN106]|uniref:LamG-like jellyroll fold domain-containing protein n=1 Tax=Ferruginibacter sp. SUN106 TaxID=2978348 RepID=UPI003D36D24C